MQSTIDFINKGKNFNIFNHFYFRTIKRFNHFKSKFIQKNKKIQIKLLKLLLTTAHKARIFQYKCKYFIHFLI